MSRIWVFALVYYILWAINYILVRLKKESSFISLITWAFLCVLFTSNVATDGDAYKYKIDYEYNAFGNGWAEKGYELIKWICKSIGVKSYNHFLIVLFAIASVLLFYGIRKMQGSFHIAFFSTMLFIFPSMATAIRFFLAFAVFVFCFDYLIKGEWIRYLVGIVVAISFHRAALFFLIFLLCAPVYKHRIDEKLKRQLVRVIGFLASVCTIYTLFFRQLPFMKLITLIFLNYIPKGKEKLEAYFGSATRLGFLVLVILYATSFLLSKYMARVVRSEQSDENIKKLSLFGYSINILMAVTLPFAIISLAFFRLYGVQTFINCIIYSRIISQSKPYKRGKATIIELLYLMAVCAWAIPAFFRINSISVYGMINASGITR